MVKIRPVIATYRKFIDAAKRKNWEISSLSKLSAIKYLML